MKLWRASSTDLERLAELVEGTLPSGWTRASLEGELGRSGSLVLLGARESRGPAEGFLIGRVVVDEAEVLLVAVLEPARRSGLGSALMLEFVVGAAALGARSVWLELRSADRGARAFYEGLGYRVTGERRGYYEDDDATLMVLALQEPGPAG